MAFLFTRLIALQGDEESMFDPSIEVKAMSSISVSVSFGRTVLYKSTNLI